MVYFLMMTWSWWLLAIAIAVAAIWLISRCWSRWNWPTAERDTSDRDTAGRDTGELAAAKARIAELESQVGEIPVLKATIARLEADADRRGEPVPAADR